MNKYYFLLKIFIICLLLNPTVLAAKTKYFEEGKILFDKKEFKKSQIFFERDIVFNPKSEKSYLYLAKIFNENDDDEQQEINLNNVLVVNPQNEEAIYMLVVLKIKQSNYDEAKKLIEKFNLICKSFCSKKIEIEDKFNKLIPKDEKNKN